MRLLFRADATFAKPEVYEYLEPRDISYAIRLPANEVLQEHIKHLLKRPVGDRRRSPSYGTMISGTGRGAGITLGGWWLKWNGTR